MNELQDFILIGEIAFQAKIALRSIHQLNKIKRDADQIAIWTLLQSILVSSANVSRIMWPSKSNETRGLRLRETLNICEIRVLSERKFRNHFEHYDQRVEDWFFNNSSSSYTDLAFNPSLCSSLPRIIHRGFDIFSNTLIFRNEKYEIDYLKEDLEYILIKCEGFTL